MRASVVHRLQANRKVGQMQVRIHPSAWDVQTIPDEVGSMLALQQIDDRFRAINFD